MSLGAVRAPGLDFSGLARLTTRLGDLKWQLRMQPRLTSARASASLRRNPRATYSPPRYASWTRGLSSSASAVSLRVMLPLSMT
ncbi:MAG: hypothetical protein MZW92_64125 [Comamonadaceae bacterium]|nr:hypothetical protein [Comamonadaceae bacterium]